VIAAGQTLDFEVLDPAAVISGKMMFTGKLEKWKLEPIRFLRALNLRLEK
jgi:hypothetical protein